MATLISIYVPIIYGLFILAADVVFVIVLPPLTCALFFKFSNAYGAFCGFLVGLFCRLGAGEYFLKFDHFIKYPFFSDQFGQVFPFRTFSMLCSLFTILLISFITNLLFDKNIVPSSCDIFKKRAEYAVSMESTNVTSCDSPDTLYVPSTSTVENIGDETADEDEDKPETNRNMYGDQLSVL